MTPSRRATANVATASEPVAGDLRNRLVDVATELFAVKGFEGTSVQDVCDAAQVTKGALYYYFSSKDELLYDIYGRLLRLQMAHLEEFAEVDLPVLERIRLIVVDVIVTSIAQMDQAVIFWRSLHQLRPEMQATVRQERRRYHERFRDVLLEGQKAGLVRSDIDVNVMIDYFYGSAHHLSSWYRKDGALTPAEVGDQFGELFLSSISV